VSVTVAVVSGMPSRALQPADQGAGRAPSTVYGPLPFTRTVLDAPDGPASLLVSGTGSFTGSALLPYEGRSLVVGASGTYRLVRTVSDANAGDGLLLSPDGRMVAGSPQLEGATSGDGSPNGTVLIDLTSGAVRELPGGAPVAFSPDGTELLTARSPEAGSSEYRMALLDLAAGASRELFSVGGPPRGGQFAFSPDGRRLAVQSSQSLTIYDTETLDQATVPATGARRMAGVGAWTPDGYLAAWDVEPSGAAVDPHVMRLVLIDPATGATAAGPVFDPVSGLAAWVLGWQSDGAAVVQSFHGAIMAPGEPIDFTRSARLDAYRPGGGRSELVQLPGDATRVDVARDWLDHFGAPAPSWPARALDVLAGRVLEAILLCLVVAISITVAGWHRRRGAARRCRSVRTVD
jgi:WD40-like Beta Propeller Repeat